MGYVIAGILVLLIVTAFIVFLVMNSTRRQSQAAAEERDYGEGTPGSDFGILASDSNTPLGDTDQHAGEQTAEGTTARDPEGAGTEQRSQNAASGGEGGAGGEAESGGRAVTPRSERLANRPR